MTKLPRGLRVNNAMNIRISNTPWMGKLVPSVDPAFETFDNAQHGIRAGAKILLTYFEKYKLNTIADIVTRWAPPIENNTLAYIRAVCVDTGFAINQQLDLGEPSVVAALVKAIIRHEQGYVPFTDDEILDAVNAAYL